MDYYIRHMKDGTFVSWIAVTDGKIIGTSGISVIVLFDILGCKNLIKN